MALAAEKKRTGDGMKISEKKPETPLQLEKKDIFLLIPAMLLGLAGLGPDDRMVVIPCLAFSLVSLLWICLKHRGSMKWRVAAAIGSILVIGFVGFRRIESISSSQQQITAKPSQITKSDASARSCDPDVQYVPPKGKAIRFDGSNPMPSEVLCPSRGLSEEERIACLCPSRLPYVLRAMPPPTNSNFETEITISKVCAPMYKVRVFLKDVYSTLGMTFEASPYMAPASHVLLTRGMIDYDKFSFLLNSSAPEDTFKTSVLTATGLRVICVNQEN